MNKPPPPAKWKLPLVVVGVLAIGVGLYLQRPREFEFQGKKLTRWLDDLEASQPQKTRDAAKEALRQMGTNVVPSLLAMLRSAPSYSKRQMASSIGQAELAHRRGMGGFQALGAVALPALTNYLAKPETATTTAHALSQVGGDGIPQLLHALTNENALVRQRVELGLDPSRETGQALVPALIRNLKDNDSHVRAYAALALGKLGVESDLVLPALIEALQDPNAEARSLVAEALGQFGPKAKAAILPLLNTSKDKDPQVSSAAFKALTLIDPDAAQKAGVK